MPHTIHIAVRLLQTLRSGELTRVCNNPFHHDMIRSVLEDLVRFFNSNYKLNVFTQMRLFCNILVCTFKMELGRHHEQTLDSVLYISGSFSVLYICVNRNL